MLSDNIARLRKSLGLNQTQFAKRLHVTQGAVSQWETGRTMPDMGQLISMASTFQVSLDSLNGESSFPDGRYGNAKTGGERANSMDIDIEKIMLEVKEIVAEAMKQKGVSDAECVQACGLAPTFFSEWRSGKIKMPGFDKIFKVFRYLDLSLDSLGKGGYCDPFDSVRQPPNLPMDEAEVLRLYQMQDIEGRTEILHTAYEQKKRLAQSIQCDRGGLMADEVGKILNGEHNEKEG